VGVGSKKYNERLCWSGFSSESSSLHASQWSQQNVLLHRSFSAQVCCTLSTSHPENDTEISQSLSLLSIFFFISGFWNRSQLRNHVLNLTVFSNLANDPRHFRWYIQGISIFKDAQKLIAMKDCDRSSYQEDRVEVKAEQQWARMTSESTLLLNEHALKIQPWQGNEGQSFCFFNTA
jgi:hypothetical protein